MKLRLASWAKRIASLPFATWEWIVSLIVVVQRSQFARNSVSCQRD